MHATQSIKSSICTSEIPMSKKEAITVCCWLTMRHLILVKYSMPTIISFLSTHFPFAIQRKVLEYFNELARLCINETRHTYYQENV